MFQIRIPSKTSKEDTVGVLLRVPGSEYTINKVNSSKWSDYLASKYNITFKQGDLNEFQVQFGSDTNTEIVLDGPEINNHVDGYEGYAEGDLVGRVRVNSKGLVTAVEKEPDLPEATNDSFGTIKLGYEENGKNYPIQTNDQGQAYVSVPWEPGTPVIYDMATQETAGLIKVGYEDSTSSKSVKLDEHGNAYVQPNPQVISEFGDSVTINEESDKDYFYYLPPVEGDALSCFSSEYLNNTWKSIDTFTINLDTITLEATYSCVKVVRFENPYTEKSINIKVTKSSDIRVCNMFDQNIMLEGIPLSPGQTIELVFTYWNYNNVSFNGGLSI